MGGNLVEALGKLKHAYDLWNSNLFLVARRCISTWRGRSTISGGGLRVWSPDDVLDLYWRKEELRSLEGSMGIL